jgi:hypothetical protein
MLAKIFFGEVKINKSRINKVFGYMNKGATIWLFLLLYLPSVSSM